MLRCRDWRVLPVRHEGPVYCKAIAGRKKGQCATTSTARETQLNSDARTAGQTDHEGAPQGAPQASIEVPDAMGCNCSDISRSDVQVDRLMYNLYGLAKVKIGDVERTI